MNQTSPGEELRARFLSDLTRLNRLLDEGGGTDARALARRLAPKVYLAVPGERAGELYGKLNAIAGCARFATRPAWTAA